MYVCLHGSWYQKETRIVSNWRLEGPRFLLPRRQRPPGLPRQGDLSPSPSPLLSMSLPPSFPLPVSLPPSCVFPSPSVPSTMLVEQLVLVLRHDGSRARTFVDNVASLDLTRMVAPRPWLTLSLAFNFLGQI
jgi:hypothetical protein